jgi:predicted nucleotidyltransferase
VDNSNDIDLLIEYDEHIVSIDRAIQLRAEIKGYLTNYLGAAVDICLLNKTENETTQFIIKEKGVLLLLAS